MSEPSIEFYKEALQHAGQMANAAVMLESATPLELSNIVKELLHHTCAYNKVIFKEALNRKECTVDVTHSLVIVSYSSSADDMFLIPDHEISSEVRGMLEQATGLDLDDSNVFALWHMLYDYNITSDKDNPPYTGEFHKYKIDYPDIINSKIKNVYWFSDV